MTALRPQRLRDNERGNVAVLTALTLPVLIGFVGLVADVSMWSSAKNAIQGAADQAALSAVVAAGAGESAARIQDEALSVAQSNGFANGVNGVIVTVNNPPKSGPNTTNSSAYEVIIQQPQNLYFSSIFLNAAPTVVGRAVATPGSTPPCILALSATASNSIALSGGSTNITATNCDVDSNSSSSSAIAMSGGATITAEDSNIVGNYTTSGGSKFGGATIVKVGRPAIQDPYSALTAPTPSGCNQTDYTLSGGSATINPGVYCGGITVQGGGSLTMNPGAYILTNNANTAGNFTISGSSVTGLGVSIILTSSNSSTYGYITISGGGAINLTASASGAMQGVVLYVDRNAPFNNHNQITGASTMSITGAVYLPSELLTFSGGSGSGSGCLQLVALELDFTGGSSFGRSCGSVTVPGLSASSGGVPSE